jgi:hypothetical protein
MPCYDKKLEASRQDFFDDIFQTRDVDCVVTTGELELMMKEYGWDLRSGSLLSSSAPASTPVKKYLSISRSNLPKIDLPELLIYPGTSSGSYLHAVVNHFISTSPVPLTLSVKAIRNATDYEEYILREASPPPPLSLDTNNTDINGTSTSQPGRIIFKGIKCYGFRNLQNVVRKVGRERGVRVGSGAAGRLGTGGAGTGSGTTAGRGVRRLRAARKGGQGGNSITEEKRNINAGLEEEEEEKKIDYVEVMACPGGCVNGGGQLRPPLSVGMAASTTIWKNGDIDAEGYKRDWEGEGVVASPNVTSSSKWGDREWTKKVEEAYWRDPDSKNNTRLKSRLEVGDGHCGNTNANTNTNTNPIAIAIADQLVDEIIQDLCGEEGSDIDTDAERKRLFKTEYRAVQSDVIGLAVKW